MRSAFPFMLFAVLLAPSAYAASTTDSQWSVQINPFINLYSNGETPVSSDTDYAKSLVYATVLRPSYRLYSAPDFQSSVDGKIQDIGVGDVYLDKSYQNSEWLRLGSHGGAAFVTRDALDPLAIRGQFDIFSKPEAGGQSLGKASDSAGLDGLMLTGRMTQTTASGKTSQWDEVIFKGHPGWIQHEAVADQSLNFRKVEYTAASQVTHPFPIAPQGIVPSQLPPPPAPVAPVHATPTPSPAPAPVAAAPVAAAPVAAAPTPHRHRARASAGSAASSAADAASAEKAVCVVGLKEARANPRVRKILHGVNPFTTWNGPMGMASILVSPDGQAVLHMSGNDIPMAAQLCLTKENKLYIRVVGASFTSDIAFDNPGLTSATVNFQGANYQFTRTVQ